MKLDDSTKAFIALLKAGLWERDAQISSFKGVDCEKIYRLSQEQSVVGLVAAGLEHTDLKYNKDVAFNIIGDTLQIEKCNKDMNVFIGKLISFFHKNGINYLLVKGQGIAQCYKRPLWRSSGDVDLLFDAENYEKAKLLLKPLASSVEEEVPMERHISMTLDSWVVELHGTLRTCVLSNMDSVIDKVQTDAFLYDKFRIWNNNGASVNLPEVNDDVIFIFTHILKHFFKGGIGLRQICDWCRLLWINREDIDISILENRIKKANLWTEWNAFAALAVDLLGYPKDIMPLYSSKKRWSRKAEKIFRVIMDTGNFGHNRDTSYYFKYGLFLRKFFSFRRSISDSFKHILVFPIDSIRAFWYNFKYSINWIINVEHHMPIEKQ